MERLGAVGGLDDARVARNRRGAMAVTSSWQLSLRGLRVTGVVEVRRRTAPVQT